MTSTTNSDIAFSFAICRWPDRSALNLLARFTTPHREAMAQAYLSSAYTMAEIRRYFGVLYLS